MNRRDKKYKAEKVADERLLGIPTVDIVSKLEREQYDKRDIGSILFLSRLVIIERFKSEIQRKLITKEPITSIFRFENLDEETIDYIESTQKKLLLETERKKVDDYLIRRSHLKTFC